MNAIYVVVAIIGAFVYTVVKVVVSEWLPDLSMKRLSLKRDRNASRDTSEISNDESFDALPSSKRYAEYNANETSDNTVNSSSSRTNDLSFEPANIYDSNSVYGVPNNISSDEDVIVEEIPSTSRGVQSMFNWTRNNKPSFLFNSSKDDILLGPRLAEDISTESCKKPQTILIDSSDDDDYNNSNNKDGLNDFTREASPPKVMINYEEMIAGVKVKLPVKPYPCQKAVMNRLITGCTKEENCLIESPTGSGKTLALLCGALAWQEQYIEKVQEEWKKQIDDTMDIEDNIRYVEDNACCNESFNSNDKPCDKTTEKIVPKRVPKIFYSTRTHQQIGQIVRELKKTAYRHKRMTILSARDYTCIQKTDKNKNELCNELLDPRKGTGCPYYNERNKKYMASFESLQGLGLDTPWDIEDFISLGKHVGACPYFAARALMANAEIIMCPYNYITDPKIRTSMQINLKNNIIIFDEAHNIEDFCRDAASVDIKDIDLANAAEECEKLANYHNKYHDNAKKHTYFVTHKYLRDFVEFLQEVDVKNQSNESQMIVSDRWHGVQFLELLNANRIGSSRFYDFLGASKVAIQEFNEMRESRSETKIFTTISFETKATLENLCFAIEMITSKIFVSDYRTFIEETVNKSARKKVREDVWISTKNKWHRVRILKVVCMNPAVVFAPISSDARSVIVASGTLTPSTSFESELGTKFPHKLHANHIITEEQIYVRCVPRGPNNVPLKAIYKNANSWPFQDELGELVLEVCHAVPYGVLCFFTSYQTMRNTHDRWRKTHIWAKLEKLKSIFVEPQDKKGLPAVLSDYREVIENSSSISFRQESGAILFVVFRGKVAEGIDFSDNEARCVLTVGIPYANPNDLIVSMKKEYNNSNASKHLLSGSEWYTIQAFRALNQALGRCIRHINDWGAVLLVDERLQNSKYLSKWVKAMWKSDTENHKNLKIELENFVARQIARERGNEYIKNKNLKGSYKT